MRIGAVVAIAALAALVIWLLVRGGGGDSNTTSSPSATPIAPKAATPNEIRDLSVEVGRPIYWLGPRDNTVYELQRTSQDRIYVRYLTIEDRIDFHSGICDSRTWFDDEPDRRCPFATGCGAYARACGAV